MQRAAVALRNCHRNARAEAGPSGAVVVAHEREKQSFVGVLGQPGAVVEDRDANVALDRGRNGDSRLCVGDRVADRFDTARRTR